MSKKLQHAAGVVSEECISGSLDLFSPPFMETVIDSCYFTEYTPTNAISDSANSIGFQIPASDDLIDLSESLVQVKVKITKQNGQDLDAFIAGGAGNSANSVGFIQSPLTSMFSSVVIRVNDQLISDSFNTYGYLSYFQNLLNFSADARRTRLSLLGWYDDTNPNANAAHTGSSASGFKTRAGLTALSHVATFVGPIYHGLFNQSRYLVPFTPLTLEWIKAQASFCLKSNANAPTFIYKIESMKLFLRKIKIKPSYKLSLESKLLKEPAIYPIRQAYVKPFFLDQNQKQCSFENIFQNRSLPSYAAVALVTQDNYRGAYGTSPYQFDHFSLTSLKITVDNESYPTPTPFMPNYDSADRPDWSREYLALQAGGVKVNEGLGITYNAFKTSGYTIYAFNFGRENSIAQDHISPKKNGSARLDISFASTSVNPALTLLLYVESDEMLQIDGNRKVFRDYFL